MKKSKQNIWGISAGFHDAALSVINDGKIAYASHAERFSGIKNDPFLNKRLATYPLEIWGPPDVLVYYEKPLLNWTRRLYSGQKRGTSVKQHIRDLGLTKKQHGIEFHEIKKVVTVKHHESHAAAGFYTSKFKEAAIVVIDAIGEWDTTSVWIGKDNKMKKIWSKQYPHSIGLLYSAFTKRCGFEPNEEEHSLMALAAYGVPQYAEAIKRDFIEIGKGPDYRLKENVHIGIGDWMPDANPADLAASIQLVLEEYLEQLFGWVQYETKQDNLVYMGGVALNCVANGKVLLNGPFNDVWIMPNPGDAGSSLGAALAYLKERVQWDLTGPYLGEHPHGDFMSSSFDRAVDQLKVGNPIAWTYGRAEFGPRALGNRSLLIDPRFRTSRHKMNEIKQRQSFRPFAACILEEHTRDYFEVGKFSSLPYMQYAVKVKRPRDIPAVVHIDNTCRIQTVNEENNAHLFSLLTLWYKKTGCPLLLNTSLNTKGQPLINYDQQAIEFAAKYKIEHY